MWGFFNVARGMVYEELKFTLEQAMQAQKWSKSIAVLFLDPWR